jgi:hypothetical protein
MICWLFGEDGSAHTPLCRLTAPAARIRRQTMTLTLDGDDGNCDRRSSHSVPGIEM